MMCNTMEGVTKMCYWLTFTLPFDMTQTWLCLLLIFDRGETQSLKDKSTIGRLYGILVLDASCSANIVKSQTGVASRNRTKP